MPQPAPNELPLILLVEDRGDDILLIQRAFDQAKIVVAMQVVRDGEQAIAYLSGTGVFANRLEYPLPWLILLDLKMPRVDGFEVLKWIREQPGFKNIVVVVLTSSEQMKDVNQAYTLGANSFMVKPSDFEDTKALVHQIHQYWLRFNRLPDAERQPRREIKRGQRS